MNLKCSQWVWKGLKNALKTVNLACHYHEIQWDSTSHFPMTLLQVQTTWNTSPQKKETETNCEHIHMYLVLKLPYFVSEITHHIWQIVSICEISKCWRFIDYFCDFTSYENIKKSSFWLSKSEIFLWKQDKPRQTVPMSQIFLHKNNDPKTETSFYEDLYYRWMAFHLDSYSTWKLLSQLSTVRWLYRTSVKDWVIIGYIDVGDQMGWWQVGHQHKVTNITMSN